MIGQSNHWVARNTNFAILLLFQMILRYWFIQPAEMEISTKIIDSLINVINYQLDSLNRWILDCYGLDLKVCVNIT